jgi:5-methylcytosine-specific restriction protein A
MTERLRGRALQESRARILRRDDGLCVHCRELGHVTKATEIDHITPLFKGGTDDDDNKQSLCHACHSDKTARDLGKRPRLTIGLDGVPVGNHHWNK